MPELRQHEQAAAALTIGVIKGMKQRDAARQSEGLAEREEQIKIEVYGRAEEFHAWQYADIEFEIQFEDATGQRDSDFERPVFSYGAYVPVGGPVALSACVVEWKTNKKNSTTGCKLAIGIASSDFVRSFRGEIHAVFQGYGAPANVYGDVESLDSD